MGTTGPGRFTDYPGGNTDDGSGVEDEQDKCGRAFTVTLEDVERSSYYATHGSPPPEGIFLTIKLDKRIVASTQDGLTVGNLPTSYNYLAMCLKDGFIYSGYVKGTTDQPIVSVIADFAPENVS